MTSDIQIKRRLNDSKANWEIKQSFYKLRRFLAGDEASIGGSKSTISYSPLNAKRKADPQFPDFRIANHEEGVSNHTLTWVNTLVKQTIVQKPEITFPDLDAEVSQVREAYLQDRLEHCSWIDQQESILYSFLIDGIAFCKLGLICNRPAITYVDSLDVLWDIHAKYPKDFRFIAVHLRLTEDVAREHFGDKVVNQILAGRKNNDGSGENIIEVLEYWDKDTLAYVAPNCSTIYQIDENPFGFIPFETISGPIIPSMSTPLPHILGVIGAQTAHTELQRSLIEVNRKLRPVVQVNPDSYTEESFRDFMDAPEDVSVLVLENGREPAYTISSFNGNVSEMLAIKRQLEEEIVRHLGVNPFSAGSPLNVELATEVTAIQGQSGLTAQAIAIDLSMFLSKCFRKLIKVGYLYDDEDFKVRLDNDVVTFGKAFSIEPVLEEDVPCSVTPGTVETEAIKIAKGMQLANVFLQDPEIRSTYPALKMYIWKQLLTSYNVRDVDTLLQPDAETAQKMQLVQQIPMEQLIQLLQQLQQPTTQEPQNPNLGPMAA